MAQPRPCFQFCSHSIDRPPISTSDRQTARNWDLRRDENRLVMVAVFVFIFVPGCAH